MRCSNNNDGGDKRPRTVLQFRPRSKPKIESCDTAESGRSSIRLSRLMALAIRFEDLLSREEVEGYSELARRYLVDRGRISRIMQLRLLAPDIQEQLLCLEGSVNCLALKHVLPICRCVCWHQQRREFDKLIERKITG